jgi:hypothetical protein
MRVHGLVQPTADRVVSNRFSQLEMASLSRTVGWGGLRRPNAREGSYIATRSEGAEYFTIPDFG